MASDIDKMLEDLRTREAEWTQKAYSLGHGGYGREVAEASRIARQIAAAEELVAFKANHTGGLVGLGEFQTGDGIEFLPDPEMKRW